MIEIINSWQTIITHGAINSAAPRLFHRIGFSGLKPNCESLDAAHALARQNLKLISQNSDPETLLCQLCELSDQLDDNYPNLSNAERFEALRIRQAEIFENQQKRDGRIKFLSQLKSFRQNQLSRRLAK